MSANSTEYSDELPIGYRLEEFEIKSILGSGGFGITYLAQDVDLKREVVVKENLPFQCAVRDSTRSVRPRTSATDDHNQFDWALKSFMREAETLSQFDHPNIVRILRRFEANNTAYFVMPYLPGQSLKQVIDEQVAKGEAFTEPKLKELLNPLLDALQVLHASGVYHRDIKAANILLVKGHRPILIDFGAARQIISEKSHTIVESAGYTPFEQLLTDGNVGPWSDIYALAATFYTAIHGEPPPRASDRMRRDPILKLADNYSDVYSRPFLEAIDWALAPDEAQRPQTIEQWREALNGTAVAKPPALPPKPAPIKKNEAKPPAPAPIPKPVPAKPFPVKLVLTLIGGAAAAMAVLAIALHFMWPLFAKPGSLHVTSDPTGATVQIKGQPDATTPADFPTLRIGKYQVTVSAPGYDPSTVTVDIKEGQSSPLNAELKRTFGTLVLQTVPTRVSYRLIEKDDPNARESHGSTPATLADLPSGSYQMTLSVGSLGSHTVTFDIPGHQTVTRTDDLIKLSVAGDASGPAAQALLGQIPASQLDANARNDYAALLNQAIGSYLHYNMFSQADAAADALKKAGNDTAAEEKKIADARDSFQRQTSGQISDLISDQKFGAAASRLNALQETLLPDQYSALQSKFQPQLAGYQQQSAAAIKQAQSGDAASGYTQLAAFGDQHPDDVQVQIALGKLLTQMPPDHDHLGQRLAVYQKFNLQYLGTSEAGDFQQMQAHLQSELNTYNDLSDKLNAAKSGPSGLEHRIGVLQDQIADNQRKLAAGQNVDQAVNAFTGLFGQHVHVTSAAERQAAIEREQTELNKDQTALQNYQSNSAQAQSDFDAFCAKVPW
jgi:serine/threonine protein kinase